MIQALIFDFDGLILDTETPEVQIWQDLYARYGQEFPLDEWVRTVVGSTVANLDPVAQLEKLTGQPLDRTALHEQAHRTRLDWQAALPPMPGVADYLDSARRLGLRLAVASSSPHAWVDGYLNRLEFCDLFDAVICREDAPRLKPDPDLFLAALSALHVRADQALAFEDSPMAFKQPKLPDCAWSVCRTPLPPASVPCPPTWPSPRSLTSPCRICWLASATRSPSARKPR